MATAATRVVPKANCFASKDLLLGSIVLQSKPLKTFNQDLKIAAIEQAIKTEGDDLLTFTDEFKQLQKYRFHA